MKPGLYSVTLTINDQPAGEAILVLAGRTLHGGGIGYLCRGFYEDDTIRCEIWVHRKDHATIFGQQNRHRLKLERDTQEAQLIFSGYMDGKPPVPISVEFVWEGPLLESSSSSE